MYDHFPYVDLVALIGMLVVVMLIYIGGFILRMFGK